MVFFTGYGLFTTGVKIATPGEDVKPSLLPDELRGEGVEAEAGKPEQHRFVEPLREIRTISRSVSSDLARQQQAGQNRH